MLQPQIVIAKIIARSIQYQTSCRNRPLDISHHRSEYSPSGDRAGLKWRRLIAAQDFRPS